MVTLEGPFESSGPAMYGRCKPYKDRDHVCFICTAYLVPTRVSGT